MSDIPSDAIEVAIIGGGPAGLTAAGTLARQLHTAVVFDTKTYRNRNASHMHMIPTWDHRDPQEFRAEARRNILANYSTIQFADVGVTRVEKLSGSKFKVLDESGKEWNVKKLLLAVGSSDTYPEIEGYESLWGRRIYQCLYCHGYEDRGREGSGILAVAPVLMPAVIVHVAKNAAQLTKQVTVYTHGNQELAAELAAISESLYVVEARKIKRLVASGEGSSSVMVELEDGTSREEAFLVHSPKTGVQGPFVEQLGLKTTAMGNLEAEAPFFVTSERGVFAAGDCVTPYKVAAGAISSGCTAAVGVSSQLQAEKFGYPTMYAALN
ncbi:thioredoxin reductase glit-like protein [Stachybotrys elegans]|uniref:Thioredoxin reductase glit-like protein n=1 Tax=Stachybotrys elegans TaxID=80388 RepID=A0A8K0WWG0_9HYPO|nr:thioredoxin reductase glit-like protein [Stachybotrys elegans]